METQQLIRIAIREIETELNYARKTYPECEHNLASLVEEVGELSTALIENSRHNSSAENIWQEAIQVAVMAIRVATEGDSSFNYCPSDVYSFSQSNRKI